MPQTENISDDDSGPMDQSVTVDQKTLSNSEFNYLLQDCVEAFL